jgi:hypothetical protein
VEDTDNPGVLKSFRKAYDSSSQVKANKAKAASEKRRLIKENDIASQERIVARLAACPAYVPYEDLVLLLVSLR